MEEVTLTLVAIGVVTQIYMLIKFVGLAHKIEAHLEKR